MTTDEAIEAFKKNINSVKEHIEIHEALNIAIHALELQKTYENIINVTSDSCSQRGCNKCDEYRKALEHQKWIPCSERLPEENVIFCDIEGDIFIGHYNKRCDYWYADFCDDRIKSVVKWMPLPDTYEEN